MPEDVAARTRQMLHGGSASTAAAAASGEEPDQAAQPPPLQGRRSQGEAGAAATASGEAARQLRTARSTPEEAAQNRAASALAVELERHGIAALLARRNSTSSQQVAPNLAAAGPNLAQRAGSLDLGMLDLGMMPPREMQVTCSAACPSTHKVISMQVLYSLPCSKGCSHCPEPCLWGKEWPAHYYARQCGALLLCARVPCENQRSDILDMKHVLLLWPAG